SLHRGKVGRARDLKIGEIDRVVDVPQRVDVAEAYVHGGAKPEGDVCLPGPWCSRAHRHTRHQGRRGALRSTSGASAAGAGVRSATGKGNSGTAPPGSVEPATRGAGSAATGADASAVPEGEVAPGTGAGVSMVVVGTGAGVSMVVVAAGASPWGTVPSRA